MIQDRICKQCNISFTGGPRAYYCPDCRVIRQAETNIRHRSRERKGLARKIGDSDKCEKCDKSYEIKAGLQRFCEDCQRIHQLEHQRVTNLKSYHLHKDKTNPIRNLRRQMGPVKCWWCGKEFIAHNTKLTCSPECSNKRKNHLWNIWRNNGGKLKKYPGGKNETK